MNAAELKPGDLALLDHPVARELLRSTVPARLAYVALDGTPRLVPLLFHWTGEEIVFTSWPDDPKVAALRTNPVVAVTIDTDEEPFRLLSIRGTVTVTIVDGVPPEGQAAFVRSLGPEAGRAQAEKMTLLGAQTSRVAVRPTWASVLDFETRFPNGLTRRMAQAMPAGVG